MKGIVAKILYATVVLAVVITLYFASYIFGSKSKQDVVVYIPPACSTIDNILYDKKAIKERLSFVVLTKLAHLSGYPIKFGEYQIAAGSTPWQILQQLIAGKVLQHRLTVPEGLSNKQVFALLDQAYGLSGIIRFEDYQEGWLLPETYQYTYPTDKNTLLARMHKEMQKFIASNINGATLPPPLASVGDLIKIASIVEKEAQLPVERARIARVYLNRLQLNMPLQADPTVLYALTAGSYRLERKLLRADLKIDSAYNTYLHNGLPPGPIANPSRSSMLAVLHPDVSRELYFVAKGDGSHLFSDHYQQHLNNIKLIKNRG